MSDNLLRRRDIVSIPTTRLRLFLDSASMSQWELWHSTGVFHGITTNPTIIERDKVKCNIKSLTAMAQTAFDMGACEVQLQSWGQTVKKLSSVAFDLAGIDPKRIVVKLPCTLEGIQTASLLRDSNSNIRVTITGLYSSPQALLAAAVGAEYAAPYLGRMNDLRAGGTMGTEAVVEMQQIIHAQQSKMRLLVASVREPSEMAHLSAKGCDTFTISPAVASKLFMVGGTLDAAADFETAAERNGAYECDASTSGACL